MHLKRQAKMIAKASEHWTILWDTEQGCPYFYDHSTDNSTWEFPEKVWESGRHSENWLVCYDSFTQIEYYLKMSDFTVHPIDEYSKWQGHGGDYYHPPPLAKIALKQEHKPVAAYYPMPVEKGPENSVAARVRRRKERAKRGAIISKQDNTKKARKSDTKQPQTETMSEEKGRIDVERHYHKKKRKKRHKRNHKKDKLGLGDVDDPFEAPSSGRASRAKRNIGLSF